MRRHCQAVLFSLLTLGIMVFPALGQRSPEDELNSLQAGDGIEVSLFASEPMISNPSAIDIDTQGRVWVAEIQWYRKAAKDPPADKIKVLEDTDGDGQADKVTVFAEGLFAPMSVCVAGEKVYVATSPDLWVYEDKDHDLKADGPPTKLLTGFGGYNHDHGAHSLVLGPDHKWWMSHGDTGFDVTGVDGSHIQFQWGAVLRGELDGSKLETVAVNFRNPYEVSVSSFGEAYLSDNDNDGNFSVRICWILDGGNYGWFGGPPAKVPPGTPFGEHWHFRGHIPGFVPATIVTGFGSPCGMCFYESDAFGPELANLPLHADAGPREVRAYRHENAGVGKRGTSQVILTNIGDEYFRPDDICTAPDGSLLVSDWYDGGVGGHNYNNPDQGRIFRLKPVGKELKRLEKPGPYRTVSDAIAGLKSPNLATQFLAREKLLASPKESVPALTKLLNDANPNFRARALWLLDRIGGSSRESVVKQLTNDDAAFRALAVRILRRHGAQFGKEILKLKNDKSADVLREVILAIGSLPSEQGVPALVEIAKKYDGTDRYLLEAINIAAGENKPSLAAAMLKEELFNYSNLPLLQLLDPAAATEFLTQGLLSSKLDETARAALLAQLGGNAIPEAGKAALGLVNNEEAPVELRKMALGLLSANLSGAWAPLKDEPELSAGLKLALADAALQVPTLQLIADQGYESLAGAVIEMAADTKMDVSTRIAACRAASKLRADQTATVMRQLLKEETPEIQGAAAMVLVDLQQWPTVKEAIASLKSAAETNALLEQVMSSTAGALTASRWLEDGTLSAVQKKHVLSLAVNHPDANVRSLFDRFIPEDQRPKKLGSAISAEELLKLDGDARQGEKIFFQSTAAQCKNCHRVHGTGGTLGPDLSQIGKKYARDALLQTILEPSKAIAPEFIPYLLETKEGLIHAGFVIEQTDKQVVLKDAKEQLHRFARDEVESIERQEKSLMPELVLRDVTPQDAADLLAFLTSLNQGQQAVTRYRVLGPFSGENGIDHDFGPESNLANPDIQATYSSDQGTQQWQLVEAGYASGFPAVDQVKLSKARNLPTDGVTHYALVIANSVADQDATLFLGSDDSANVWVNGEQVHQFRGSRIVEKASDKIDVKLKKGRNVILLKVENPNGPGGWALSLASPSNVEFRTE